MPKRPPILTPIVDELVKAATSGRLELAKHFAALLPPKSQLGGNARELVMEVEDVFGLRRDLGPPMLPKVDFLTGQSRQDGFAWPKITVVTPTYNQGKYIEETILSVIGQNYPNLEYIVIDGGSTDETVAIIKQYADHISYWVSEKDRGQSNAINKGFKVATGEILTWLNSDDQFTEDALFKMALGFMTSGADLVAGICEIHEEGELKHRHLTSCSLRELPVDAILDLDRAWNTGQFFFQPEVFFKKSLWEKAGSHVREDCYYSMDYEMWCRFAALGAKLHVIGTPIVNYRAHPEQKTAVPEKFHAELETVRESFVTEWLKEERPVLKRPEPDVTRRIRVAMINDHGFKYGAGIAHQRIAAALDLGGCIVQVLSVSDYQNDARATGETVTAILRELAVIGPDLVIFGNLHSQWKKEVELIFEIQKSYPSFWLTHDFWLFTGRCAYVGSCKKYLNGCDHRCPTADEYPVLPPEEIHIAWQEKRKLLAACRNLTVLAYSEYARSFAQSYLQSFANEVPVERISLGVPVEKFVRTDKAEAKENLKIDPQSFTIAFSVSSISEKRKGADFLEAALHMLASEKITILLIGRLDEYSDLPDVPVVKLGYVQDHQVLVEALNAADVFVGPSRAETLGQVFLEAAMCGLPSIGFAGSGVEDAIVNDVTGILLKEQSAVLLAAAIRSLIHDRRYCERLSETAYHYARSHFSLECCFKSFHELFKRKGYIDDWQLPHKITYFRESRLVGDNP